MRIFSVIIPFYNVEPYLEQCLESVEKQTYPHFEVWLVDDGSSDQSGQIASHFVNKDERFHLTRQKNQGPSAARNTGIEQAKGDYIVFIDGDDFIRADYLEALNRHITDEDMIVIDGFFAYKGDNDIKEVRDGFCELQETLQTKELAVILGSCAGGFTTCFCIYRRIFLKKNEIWFSLKYSWSEDLDFVTQALVKVKNGTVMPGCYYFYRLSRMDSLTHQHNLKAWLDRISVLEKWVMTFEKMKIPKYDALKKKFSKLGNSCLLTGAELRYRERKVLWNRIRGNQEFLTVSEDKRCNMALTVYQCIGYPIGVKIVYAAFWIATIRKGATAGT